MNSMQQRILGEIEKRLTGRGYTVSESKSYANLGRVFVFSPEDSLNPVAEIGFGFQSDTYTMQLTVSGRRIPSQVGRADYFDFYQKYSEATRFWEVLDSELPGQPKRPTRKRKG